MTKYDPKLVEFTEKLAALMREYKVTIEINEETSNWQTYASGITLEVDHGDEYAGQRHVDVESRYIDASDVELKNE